MTNTTQTHTEETLEAAIALAPEITLARSVVKTTYKLAYAARVVAGARGKKGVSKKAQARSCGDWLALELASRILDDKNQLQLDAFTAILDANGVDHSKWTNRAKGWQGRFRMTARLALQKRVAAEEALYLADGTSVKAPGTWVARFV